MRTYRNAQAATTRKPRRKAKLAAVLAAGSLALAACGSATVEDEAPETLSNSSSETTSSASSSSSKSKEKDSKDKDGKKDKDTKSSTTAPSASNAEPAPQGSGSAGGAGSADRGAQEIAEIPEAAGFEGENAAFLDEVRELGVDVAGVEGQIVSAGHLVCNDQTAILHAVAGQMIGQERTDREFEELADTLTESARKHFC